MHIGMIGLGRMGGNMVERLRAKGLEVTGFDNNPATSEVATLADLVAALPAPRVVWVMVPAGKPTKDTIDTLAELLEPGDTIIEGGNSNFNDDIAQAAALEPKGIKYVDCGVSGGVWGRTEGYGLMVGGPDDVVETLMPIFDALRPEGPREMSFSHPGPVGAGHYAKMIHNGVEYGMMQAYAEGFALLAARKDLELPLGAIAEAWRHGTVVRSWLLDLTAGVLQDPQALGRVGARIADSGEGRWTATEAIDLGVPAPVISAALMARFASQGADDFGARLLALVRNAFGGHPLPPPKDPVGGPA